MQGGDTMKDGTIIIGSLFVVLGFDAWILATKTIAGAEGFAMGCFTSFFIWCWAKAIGSLN